MSYLARLKAADAANGSGLTTAKTATSPSDSFGSSQDRSIAEKERVGRECKSGLPAGTVAAAHSAPHGTSNSANVSPQSTVITAKRSYDSFDSSQDRLASENQCARDPDPCRHWQINFPDLEPIEAVFSPAATHSEALAAFPGSVTVVPIPNKSLRTATPTEADELRELIGNILASASTGDRTEALAVACADPEAAVISFRALAADLELGSPIPRIGEHASNAATHRQTDAGEVNQTMPDPNRKISDG